MDNSEINYGVFSDISKGLNCNILGDCEGATISRRTTKGFKRAFNLDDKTISDQNAEHMIHTAMLGTLRCLTSKNEKMKIGGTLILAGLVYFYQIG